MCRNNIGCGVQSRGEDRWETESMPRAAHQSSLQQLAVASPIVLAAPCSAHAVNDRGHNFVFCVVDKSVVEVG